MKGSAQLIVTSSPRRRKSSVGARRRLAPTTVVPALRPTAFGPTPAEGLRPAGGRQAAQTGIYLAQVDPRFRGGDEGFHFYTRAPGLGPFGLKASN
jgi:hypothetical protein